jgi:lipid-A-disaccharide synthase
MHKIMFSAGEVSGDMHGAELAAALRDIEPDIRMIGFGGSQMEAAGVELCRNMQDYNVMGFWEVFCNLRRMFRLRDVLLQAMQREKPDLLVLIDYPDFNWRLAKRAKAAGIPVFSYIPPSVWAWRKGRAKMVAETAVQIAAIFPFETKAYRDAGAAIEFVGNPLVDTVKPSMTREAAAEYFALDPGKHNVLLLPGSRQQEIMLLLPEMLKAAKLLIIKQPDTEFFLPAAPGVSRDLLEMFIQKSGIHVQIKTDCTYDLMNLCEVAIATSGTVILETALMGLPTVVLYKMSPISYFIGSMLIHVANFSLPNIIAGERIQPELLQDEVKAERIAEETLRFYRNRDEAACVKEKLKKIREQLGAPHAAKRAANLILATADRCKQKLLEDNNE